MSIRRTKRNAFTLVEILIVVVILGILAAIVVPQFTNAADDARTGNLETQLSTLQNQIELYRAREGSYPDLSADWDDLIDGNYIKAEPANPAWPGGGDAASDVSEAAGATGSATTGWVFNTTDNTIYASYFDEDGSVAGDNIPVVTDTATD